MSVKNVLLLGDEQLYEFCRPIEQGEMDIAKKILNDLGDTMDNFKKKYGFGRAIAAPQIGQSRRVVYLNTGDQKIHFINPELEFLSQEKFKIWDDCMSFPGLEVLVWRYKKVKVFYKDLDFKDCEITFEGDLAELIQHECDHLDGMLATQRSIDRKSFRMNREKAICY